MSFSDWMQEINDTNKNSFNTYFRLMKRLMVEHKIAAVDVRYEGSGDSGMWEVESASAEDGSAVCLENCPNTQLDGVTPIQAYAPALVDKQTWNEQRKMWETIQEKRQLPLSEIINEVASAAMSLKISGWENNDGGQGYVILTQEGVTIDHNEYEMVTRNHKYELTPEETPMERLTDGLTD